MGNPEVVNNQPNDPPPAAFRMHFPSQKSAPEIPKFASFANLPPAKMNRPNRMKT